MTPLDFLAAVLPSSGFYCVAELSSNKKEHRYVTSVQELEEIANGFDAAHKDAILLQYGSQVMSVTQPANSSHKDELDALNVVVARSTLIYKKFRYVVHFKYMGDVNQTLEAWLHKYFQDQPSHTYKLVLDWWSIKVYLADEGDMTAIKLSWHEHIQCIKTVMLVS